MDEHPIGMSSHANPSGPLPGPGNNGNGLNRNGGGVRQPPAPQEELQQPQYTIPGIPHCIRHEWARFEMERVHWEVERTELQARIAFLQGERKGQENLKKDQVKRIKMLEYALKQEK